jgi:hypothetical protein
MESDLANLKSDSAELKSEIAELRVAIAEFRSDLINWIVGVVFLAQLVPLLEELLTK